MKLSEHEIYLAAWAEDAVMLIGEDMDYRHYADMLAEAHEYIAQLEAELERCSECGFCKAKSVKPPSSDPNIGYLWILPIDSPMKKLEAKNEALKKAGKESAVQLRKFLGFGPSTTLELLLTGEANG